MDRSSMLAPVIEYYVGCAIESIENRDKEILFSTRWGRGKIKKNRRGNWEIYINDEKVSLIEKDVFRTITESSNTPDVQKYYNELKELLASNLTFRSSCLIKDIMVSLEYLLIHESVRINKPINVGKFFMFMMGGKKEIICLN